MDTINHEAIFEEVLKLFHLWEPKIMKESNCREFREFIKEEFGFEFTNHDGTAFRVRVTDDKKFMWFLLKHV